MYNSPTADRSKLTISGQPSLSSVFGNPMAPVSPAWKNAMSGMKIDGNGQLVRNPSAPAPSAPVSGPVQAPRPAGPVAPAPVAPSAPAPSAPAQAEVPANWKNPDGSMKTAEQIAAEIASVLKTTNEMPDIGKLAGDQFGGAGKTAEQLQTEATLLNNTRNDIAVGENDPYKVASQSGIAYTPEELKAIEQAYAGVYTPALAGAISKLETKRLQDEEERKAALEAASQDGGFTLGKDQVRYDKDGNIIASGISGSPLGGGGTYTKGSDSTVDAWVSMIASQRAKLENVPEELRGIVAQGVAQIPNPKAKYLLDQADEGMNAIDSALNWITGASSGSLNTAGGPIRRSLTGLIPGSDTFNLNANIKTLEALIGFDSLNKMREAAASGASGLGQVTEKELAYLQSLQGNLSTLQGNEQLEATLNRIRESFQNIQIENSPDGSVFELDGENYIKQGDQMIPESSFKSVGGDTNQALNRPQRNNNPGNVKVGGVGDQFAIGIDDQNHLIFPTPEAGMQALRADLSAKINGNSRFVGPNPTISELGAVYAEDGSWGQKVAAILGVSPSTRTGEIPFDRLMEAVMRQEGYYA